MKLGIILIIAMFVLLITQPISFACGGCLFGNKAHAQEDTTKTESEINIKEVYQCPNCGYEQDKPGKCPMCNTELKKVKVARTYSCPTCDYSQKQPGKCPMCKSDLIEKDIRYECPMCKMSSIKPGKCPKCGMKLEEKSKPIEKLKHR